MDSKLKININKDDDKINDFLYCWDVFSSRPNKTTIYNTYSTIGFNKIIKSYLDLVEVGDKNIFTEIIPSDDFNIVNEKILTKVNESIFISYLVLDKNNDSSIINEISFLYKKNSNEVEIQKIIEDLNTCLVEFSDADCEKYKLNTIGVANGGLEIEPIDSGKIEIEDFEFYYSNKTMKGLDKLIKSIKKSGKGLSILYGERGTGKTSTIYYISSKLDSIVIFIPNNMIENTINNPDFRKFLKKHYKPVIIIDDCEMLFNEAFTKSNIFVNNLLQMVDGFLADSMEVNIITIFNVENDSEIDHSLIDCNSLIDIVKFEYLSEDESNDLSKHLEYNKKYKNKNRLIDIIRKKKPKSSDIGF